MYIRPSRLEDLSEIMAIYDHAKMFMYSHGNSHQWIKGYPSDELITEQIHQHYSFVFINDIGKIVGTFCFIIGEDPTYREIKGRWLNEDVYGTIHRIASSGQQKGLFKLCVDWCIRQCSNLRIDTHQDNLIMQNAILKNGFQKCGLIRLPDGSQRIAFQLIKAGYMNVNRLD